MQKNRLIEQRTEKEWRSILATIPDSQEKNVLALVVWWEFLSKALCTKSELPSFLTEYHMRYRATATVADKDALQSLMLAVGFNPSYIVKKMMGVNYAFRSAPEDPQIVREIFAAEVTKL